MIGTIVIFEKIEPPVGKPASVHRLMLVAAGKFGACERPRRCVESGLETQRMNVVRQRLHVGKAAIRPNCTIGVARLTSEHRVLASGLTIQASSIFTYW